MVDALYRQGNGVLGMPRTIARAKRTSCNEIQRSVHGSKTCVFNRMLGPWTYCNIICERQRETRLKARLDLNKKSHYVKVDVRSA